MSYYTKLNVESNIAQRILDKALNSDESKWKRFLEQNIFKLDISDFEDDPDIYKIIKHFNCEDRLSVFKVGPSCSYDWHSDTIRGAAFNLLLNSFDSMIVFGESSIYRSHNNLCRLQYEPNTYFLLNVSKQHCVFNFDEARYIVSIGVPEAKYEEVEAYLINNHLK